jgi:hypothetical protein
MARHYNAAIMTRHGIVLGSALVAAILWGGDAATQSRASAAATFSEHVAPILFANCTSCHRAGEAAPFPLTAFAEARPLARQIARMVQRREMPPWMPEDSDYPFMHRRGLTVEQIAVIERWVAAGAPEGDRSKLPPLPSFTTGWQIGTPDLVVRMPEPFDVPATGADVYRNFVVPLNLDADVWVRAVDFRPSARTVVHHSLFFLDATGAAREQDARDPLPGFAGGMGGVGFRLSGNNTGLIGLAGLLGVGGQPLSRSGGTLGGWAVGARANELPDGLAYFVPKGADLILSTHFHPSGQAEREQSSLGLYFSKTPPQQAFTAIQLPPIFGVLEGLDIAPGDSSYSLSDSFTLPVDVRGFRVGGHAHYLAKEMKLTATLPDGASKTLLWIKDWDFAWQEQYLFKEFVDLPKGTRLDARITYDNSAANPRNPNKPPARVTWGEESNDEMGSMTLLVVAAVPEQLAELQAAIATHVRQAAIARPGLQRFIKRPPQ